jgi:hypothetical protein
MEIFSLSSGALKVCDNDSFTVRILCWTMSIFRDIVYVHIVREICPSPPSGHCLPLYNDRFILLFSFNIIGDGWYPGGPSFDPKHATNFK